MYMSITTGVLSYNRWWLILEKKNTLGGKTMTHQIATILIIITKDLERQWFLNSGWLCTIISSGRGAINMKLKQIQDKLNVWRDSAVITKQTSQWDYYFPWALLLYVIRCDILPPTCCSAAEWLKQPINHSFHPFHYYRWLLLLPVKSCDRSQRFESTLLRQRHICQIFDLLTICHFWAAFIFIHTDVITLQQYSIAQWISK